MRVLVVEDDPELGPWLQSTLAEKFGTVDLVASLGDGLSALGTQPFDLVVADRRLPDGDGTEILGAVRRLSARPRVLMLTAFDDPNDIAKALDAGADDYLPKPFEMVELVARARAVLRRTASDRDGRTVVGNMVFDHVGRVLFVDGAPVTIPRRELAMLEALLRRLGQVVLRESLESATYGFEDEIQSNAVDSHMSRLRKRLRENDCCVEIRTVRGLGYLLSSGA